MTHHIKPFPTKPEGLGSIPRTYIVEGKSRLLQSSDFHMCNTHTHTNNRNDTELINGNPASLQIYIFSNIRSLRPT